MKKPAKKMAPPPKKFSFPANSIMGGT
jgi:hypothetical protein